MTEYHLAQLNVGILRHPLEDPRMHGFTSMLDTLNEVADNAPGFVWRLVEDGGNDATAIRTSLGDDVLVNMSVWENRDALWDYVYRSGHLDMLRRRSEWFELPKAPFQVLWWVPAGHVPTVEEAVERLELLREKGSSPSAFGFRDSYLPEGAASAS
ncbi:MULTISPECIES: DUF3291 domain-containing protein [Amycolatopsis]|uniref:DUF3291 domain-containing protein n=1 Tax=Amycolatopsis dendrobii TaxID=2760662 RepID=A0A7W3W4W5_9PSEU|nr:MULTISPECIES: DUF3291 domain-containing protein [Amycolatopsis]MBB1158342.1 DUF3291 domain-containing protein [Amycolatopsis dendrobii]UKD56843.1 DUF3291 domain-containing protein [Amycolatopsis sp. FU40]